MLCWFSFGGDLDLERKQEMSQHSVLSSVVSTALCVLLFLFFALLTMFLAESILLGKKEKTIKELNEKLKRIKGEKQ